MRRTCRLIFLSVSVIGLASDTAGALVFFALLLPQITASTRRLHDVGKSGWLLLVALIPLVGQLIVLYWCVLPGTATDNDFGPPDSAA